MFSGPRRPGKQSFRFAAAGVADGRYEIVLSATDGKQTVTTAIPVFVDRTVRLFTATPLAFSPNGDGVADELDFSFELTRAASVRLDIAQSGRTIASVYSADLQPGSQTVTWNGAGSSLFRRRGARTWGRWTNGRSSGSSARRRWC